MATVRDLSENKAPSLLTTVDRHLSRNTFYTATDLASLAAPIYPGQTAIAGGKRYRAIAGPAGLVWTLIARPSGAAPNGIGLNFTSQSYNSGNNLDQAFVLGNNITVSRVTTGKATYIDNTGSLVEAADNLMRFDYTFGASPTFRGVLIEPARTNSIRNPRFEGGSTGVSATPPTNMSIAVAGGLTYNILGYGTQNGVPYMDVQVSGTATNTFNIMAILFEPNSAITAANNEGWYASAYMQVIAGTLPSTLNSYFQVYTSGAGLLGTQDSASSSPNTWQRVTRLCQLGFGATTARILSGCRLSAAAVASSYNVTIRVGGPQLERYADSSTFYTANILGETSLILPPVGTPGISSRPDDSVVISGLAAMLGSSAGTYLFEGSVKNNNPGFGWQGNLFTVSDHVEGSYNGGRTLTTNNNSSQVRLRSIKTDGSIQDGPNESLSADTSFKLAVAFDGSSMTSSLNGGAVKTTVAAFAHPNTFDKLYLGAGPTGGAGISTIGNVSIKQFKGYNYKFTDANLQALSA